MTTEDDLRAELRDLNNAVRLERGCTNIQEVGCTGVRICVGCPSCWAASARIKRIEELLAGEAEKRRTCYDLPPADTATGVR